MAAYYNCCVRASLPAIIMAREGPICQTVKMARERSPYLPIIMAV
jgi:hypothetical protein